ncbi:MAG: hypothetical protein O3B95_06705 [Chloroflexi bacterium]|nr:hypothetical protein [Chloroflexota bacterium]
MRYDPGRMQIEAMRREAEARLRATQGGRGYRRSGVRNRLITLAIMIVVLAAVIFVMFSTATVSTTE